MRVEAQLTERHLDFDDMIEELTVEYYLDIQINMYRSIMGFERLIREYFADMRKISKEPTLSKLSEKAISKLYNPLYLQLKACASKISAAFKQWDKIDNSVNRIMDEMDKKIATGNLNESEVSNLKIQVQQSTEPLRMDCEKKGLYYKQLLEHFTFVVRELGEVFLEKIKQPGKPKTWVKDVFKDFAFQFALVNQKLEV